jgi:RNA 2',3'-cyclic 3'-phosphodiesterase
MRLFVALDIEPEIRGRIGEFRDQMRVLAPDVRWVAPETFHVTLQFLGETSKTEAIRASLHKVVGKPIHLSFRDAGFFPNPKSPRVFWIGIEADDALQELVDAIGQELQPLGFAREAGPYKPHLTLARSGSGQPKPVPGESTAPALHRVRDKLAGSDVPDFGTMTAHEFFLYESKLTSAGAKYSKIAGYPLK